MKTLRFTLAALSLAALSARVTGQSAPTETAPTHVVFAPMTAEQLDQLVGPIALYPDALIALILPASTAPTDIVLAARYLHDRPNDLSQVESRAWDDSVKSLTHYPEVLKWMDENLTWTKQLGEQFTLQPAEVMKAIQRLRARARGNGALIDTPQQQVLLESTAIRIVPAQPQVIYVPYYDPAVVFVDRPVYYSRPLVTFSSGWRVGSWLAYDFDWHRCHIWVGDRHRRWHHHHDWRRPLIPVAHVHVKHYTSHRPPRQWHPPASRGHRSFPRPPSHSAGHLVDSGAALPRVPPLQIATPSLLTQDGPGRVDENRSKHRRPHVTSTSSAQGASASHAVISPAPRMTFRNNAPVTVTGPVVGPHVSSTSAAQSASASHAVSPPPAPRMTFRSSAPVTVTGPVAGPHVSSHPSVAAPIAQSAPRTHDLRRPVQSARTFDARSRTPHVAPSVASLPSAPALHVNTPVHSRTYPTVAPARTYAAPAPARYEAPTMHAHVAPPPPPPPPPASPRAAPADGNRIRAPRNAEEH